MKSGRVPTSVGSRGAVAALAAGGEDGEDSPGVSADVPADLQAADRRSSTRATLRIRSGCITTMVEPDRQEGAKK